MFPTLSRTNFNSLVTFSSCFSNAFNLDQSKILLFGKELINLMTTDTPLIHYHTMQHFHTLKTYSCGKHREKKEKLLVTSNFCFSHIVFFPIWHLFFHFKCTLKCLLQFVSIWTSLNFCCLVMG